MTALTGKSTKIRKKAPLCVWTSVFGNSIIEPDVRIIFNIFSYKNEKQFYFSDVFDIMLYKLINA